MANIGDDLARLATLRDQGVLTQEEFEEQKARILNGGAPPAEPAMPAKNKSTAGKGCLIAIAVIVGLLILIGIAGSNGSAPSNVTAPAADAGSTEVGAAKSESSTEVGAAKSETVAEEPSNNPLAGLIGPQANAARSAQRYLDMSGFSRRGLIDQLSSDAGEGYSVADATAAVDSLNADWNEQAARSAKQYLEMSGFSCSGLIEQLSSDAGSNYTKAQARYGAQQAGAC